jgi:hypothetical protein
MEIVKKGNTKPKNTLLKHPVTSAWWSGKDWADNKKSARRYYVGSIKRVAASVEKKQDVKPLVVEDVPPAPLTENENKVVEHLTDTGDLTELTVAEVQSLLVAYAHWYGFPAWGDNELSLAHAKNIDSAYEKLLNLVGWTRQDALNAFENLQDNTYR